MSSSLFQSKLFDQALVKRQAMMKVTNALRLINGKGDSCPGLTIDQYHQHFVIQLFDEQWEKELSEIVQYIDDKFRPQYIIAKWRISEDGRSLDDPQVKVLFQPADSKTTVIENGLKFQVDVNDTVNVGLFLDMRDNRQRVARLVKDKRVLNTFAYTCSFGVYCKAAGAQDVINIDISKKILEKGKANYQLNNLEIKPPEFLVRDTEDYLRWCLKKGKKFDCIILDPPSFSRHDGHVFSIQKKISRLIEMAIESLTPQGNVFIATNCSSISIHQLKGYVIEKMRKFKYGVKQVESFHQAKDFTESGKMKESCLAALLVSLS